MRGVQAIEGVVFRITIARRASVWQLTQSVLKKWLRAEFGDQVQNMAGHPPRTAPE
jgi:hypothetical protein